MIDAPAWLFVGMALILFPAAVAALVAGLVFWFIKQAWPEVA